jgi:hypothetical protein
MRKDREGKRKKTVQILLGLFIVFIMVASVLELTLYRGNGGELQYGKYTFSVDEKTRLYTTMVDKKQYAFRYFPGELLDINVSAGVRPLLANAQAIIYTFDPNMTDVQHVEQVRYELARDLPKQSILAVTDNTTGYENLPVASCADAAPLMPVIYFSSAENSSITVQGSCILVQGQGLHFYRLRDVLLYTYLGVLES